ncbi:unnamed protein product [Haemonchus placei]|uniref:Ovule protein n=1 Tax=Haemonchus placei TaxID=6290 RepID=A0A0N4WHX9_HAEPC|nr:unnamed protein product [Haemonchus placei]
MSLGEYTRCRTVMKRMTLCTKFQCECLKSTSQPKVLPSLDELNVLFYSIVLVMIKTIL